MKITSLRVVGFALAMLSMMPAASAHDVWLTLAGDAGHRRVVVNYGHPDDRPPTLPDKILDLLAVTSGGKTSLLAGVVPAEIKGAFVAQSQPFTDGGNVLLTARYDNGYWIKTKDGLYRNATRRLVPDATETFWSSKYVKAVTGPGAPWQIVTGHDLEIMPLTDPAAIKPGQSLHVKVLFHGKPLAGADVERSDGMTVVAEKNIPRFTTDAEGVSSIPIAAAGSYLLVIDHRVSPSATPDQADQDLYGATFWFSAARP